MGGDDFPETAAGDGHPEGEIHYQRARRLFAEYEHSGEGDRLAAALASFRAAAAATPPGATYHAAYLVNLAIALQAEFDRTGDADLLAEAVLNARAALAATPPGHPDLAAHHSVVGSALRKQYEFSGDNATLAEAVQAARAALAGTPAAGPQRARYLGNLGIALQTLYQRTGRAELLEEALQAGQDAVDMAAADDPHRPIYLSGLVAAMVSSAVRSGDAGPLTRAVQLARDLVAATPAGHVARPGYLVNLAGALESMYSRTGQVDALAESVQAMREAVAAIPADRAHHALGQANLGANLFRLFQHTGDSGLLTEAIQAFRDALAAYPDSHPRRFRALTFLSVGLLALHERYQQQDMLAEALQTAREAVQAVPADHPDRVSCLSSLVTTLLTAVDRTGDTDTLNEAIAVARTAATAPALSGPVRATVLTDLSNGLLGRYRSTQDLGVLSEIIQVREEALANIPADHPDHADRLGNLADSLRELAERTGQPELLTRARALFLEGGDNTVADVSTRIRAYKQAGLIPAADARDADQALRAVEAGIALLPMLTSRGLMRVDRTQRLTSLGPVAENAAAAALNARRPDRAVELLEQARGLLVSDLLDGDADVHGLRSQHPEIATELDELRDQLRVLDTENELPEPEITTAGHQDQIMARQWAHEAAATIRQEATDAWDACLAKVRALPGFGAFLRPPTVASLSHQARSGPVVFVTTSPLRCDALILRDNPDDPVVVVPLAGLTQSLAYEQARRLLRACHEAIPAADTVAQIAAAQREVLDVLAWLWDAVTGPVLDAVGTTERVWWCPVGVMTALPLHAAGHHDDVNGADPALRARPRTVLDRTVSSYAMTIRGLATARARSPHGHTTPPLIVAVPDHPGAPPLPGIEWEIADLTALIPDAQQLPSPTRQAVVAALPDHAITHFACHGYTNWLNPDASYLAVEDASAPLTVANVSALRLNAGLAYLAACDVTYTHQQLADEALHITGAFHLAGYRHVIGTLWPVNDLQAALVTADVYRHLTEDGSAPPDVGRAPHALHQAVRSLRDKRPGMPFAWAGYVHVGG